MLYIGAGAMAVDIGIRLFSNGISITQAIYETGRNLIFGKPKSDSERIDELTQLTQEQDAKIEQLSKQIEELTNKQLHRVRSN